MGTKTQRLLKYIKPAAIPTSILILLSSAVTLYYFLTTPPSAIVVSAEDPPAGLCTTFTANTFVDLVAAHLQQIVFIADSSDVKDLARYQGLAPISPRQILVPIRALSNSPSPVFSKQWKGLSFNSLRHLGTGLRARRFLELEVIGSPQNGCRLSAVLKERPQFLAKQLGSAPRTGGPCLDFEKCVDDLAQQIQRSLDQDRLLRFYIKTSTADANRNIIALYTTALPGRPLAADDLVAWGNAFYALGQFDQALQKYQEALELDATSCPARIARGYLYCSRPHATTQLIADLDRAEKGFKDGIACDSQNVFAHTNLCYTLLRRWSASPNADPQLLVEARQHCERALEINPRFVVAAVNSGYIIYRQGRHDEAIHYFDELSQRYPTNSALYLNYGFLLYLEYLNGNKDRLREALERTRKAWDLDQKSEPAANNLGYFYYELGDYVTAVDFWNKADALKAGDPDCLAGLALGTYKLGDRETAVMLLSRAARLDSHYRDSAFLRRNGNWSERAAVDLGELVRRLPPVASK